MLAYWLWENYVPDRMAGGWFNYNSSQPRLHSKLELGDDLWLCTRIKDRLLVVAQLRVASKVMNGPHYRYGRFRVWGDLQASRYFADDGRNDTELVRSVLDPKPHGESARVVQSLQAIRVLREDRRAILEAAAVSFPGDPLLRRDDEELILEATIDRDDPPPTPWPGRHLARQNGKDLRVLYDGRCQLCAFDGGAVFGVDVSEVHHLVPFSRGGSHDKSNLCVLCPNHHRVIHATSAPFDWGKLGFVFPNSRYEPLTLNRHLEPTRQH